LRGIENDLTQFEAAGVRPVAISVDAPAQSESLRRKAGYTFTFLSDPSLDAIKRYGIVHKGAGEGGRDIARPAEFLIDRADVVRWENLTGDIRVRARPEQMLAAARGLR
jgi:peroxiredoxin